MIRAFIALSVFLGLAVAAAFVVWPPFYAPSGSMKPTLLINDYFVVNRFAYDADGNGVAQGDIVTYRHPTTGQAFMGRIVGLGNDTVQIANGRLVLNGTEAEMSAQPAFEEVYAAQGSARQPPRCSNDPVAAGETCLKNRWTETLPSGASYDVLDIGLFENSTQDQTPVFEVPEGHVFILGDNRDNSIDSRIGPSARGPGFVSVENLIGRAERILVSLDGQPGRLFRKIQ